MKKLIIAAFLFLSVQPCYALLSPFNQSIEEIQSILQSTQLQNYFPQSESIVDIRRTEKGYILYSQTVQMLVEIVYTPTQRPGKQQYKVVFHEPKIIESATE